MGYSVPCRHNAYSVWAVLRESDLQVALSHKGNWSVAKLPRPLCVSTDSQKLNKLALNMVKAASWPRNWLKRPIALW